MSAGPKKHPLKAMREEFHIVVDRFFDHAEERYLARPPAVQDAPTQQPERKADPPTKAVSVPGSGSTNGDVQLRMFLDELSRKK